MSKLIIGATFILSLFSIVLTLLKSKKINEQSKEITIIKRGIVSLTQRHDIMADRIDLTDQRIVKAREDIDSNSNRILRLFKNSESND